MVSPKVGAGAEAGGALAADAIAHKVYVHFADATAAIACAQVPRGR